MSLAQHWAWCGSSFRPENGLPLLDRGFRYGMAIFETIAVRDGVPLFLEPHLARLHEGAQKAGFPIPLAALAAVGSAIRNSQSKIPFGVARIYLTAGPGAFDAPANAPGLYLLFEPRPPIPPSVRETGYRVHSVPMDWLPPLPGFKTANYWANIHALAAAKREGADEGLLAHPLRGILSATMANLFLVRAGRIITPSVDAGARAGITREWVIARREVEQRPVGASELQEADEMFLTSSGIGIMPVTSLGDRTLPARDTADGLQSEYETFVRETIAS